MAVLLLVIGGFFLGGAYSFYSQRKGWLLTSLLALFAVGCIVAGALRL
jgi:hypothetical protein